MRSWCPGPDLPGMPHSPREVHPPKGTGQHGAPQSPRRPARRGLRPVSARRYGCRPRAPPCRRLLRVPRSAPALLRPLLELRLRGYFLRPLGRGHPRCLAGRRRTAHPHPRPGRRTQPPRRLGRNRAHPLAHRSLPLVRPPGALCHIHQNMALHRLPPAGEMRLPSRSPTSATSTRPSAPVPVRPPPSKTAFKSPSPHETTPAPASRRAVPGPLLV
jgi:hypothetical protein